MHDENPRRPGETGEVAYQDNMQAALDALIAAEDMLARTEDTWNWWMRWFRRMFGPVSHMRDFVD